MKTDKQIIQEALARECTVDVDGKFVVPDDFFTRLNAELNRNKGSLKSILERLIDEEEGK